MASNGVFEYQESAVEAIKDNLKKLKNEYQDTIILDSMNRCYNVLNSLAICPELSEYKLDAIANKLKTQSENFADELETAHRKIEYVHNAIKSGVKAGKTIFSTLDYSSIGTPRINSPYDELEYCKRKAEEARRKGNTEEADRWSKRANDLSKRLNPGSTYGNSSHIPTDGKAPNVRGNDNETSQPNNNTNANQSSNGVTNNTVSGNSNNNTNANTSNNGTQRNVETEEERKRQEEEKKRQEEERKRQEEEKNRQEEERRRQEEERKRQEEERKRQEEERRRQEEEKNRQEEERKRQEEERRRQEEEKNRQENQGANAGNDVAIPPTPGNNGNGSNNGTTIPIPNTETHSDNPIGAGIDQVTPDKAGDGTGTSIVGEAKDLFKNRGKSTPDSKPVLPKSGSTKSSTSTNSKGFNPVPLAVGLGAAVAGGVGIKAYKDHKENSSFNDENEDSFSNGNRFWSEEDPNVINSEEDMVSGDDLFNEQATSPSYSAMINNDSNSQEGWTLDEETSESNDSFDLLGDN